MKIFRSCAEAAGRLEAPAVALGNFDGVHRGHQALFARTISLAHHEGGEAVALTFSPHPARFFNPELAPPLITTEEQKLELMRACGLDAIVVQPFTADFASLSPYAFAKDVLARQLGVQHVVVGRGYVFGKKRAGNLGMLQQFGNDFGFQAHGIEPVRARSIVVSSTKIREFLLMGRVRGAATLLGREFSVEGEVVRGKGRGQTIGIPTANILTDGEIIPGRGVYAGRVRLPDESVRDGVINIGTNPTFEQAAVISFEVHVLDFSGDLYGQRATVMFSRRLRDEVRFDSVEELVQAIGGDINRARILLRERLPEQEE